MTTHKTRKSAVLRGYLRFVPALVMAAPVVAQAAPIRIPRTAGQPEITSRNIPVLKIGRLKFRDLNRDGVLEPYEDWRLTAEARADNLVRRMQLPEKIGAMLHANLPGLGSGWGFSTVGYDFRRLRVLVQERALNSFLTRIVVDPETLAEQNNAAQEVAESTRLGIPLTISTDPRNHFQHVAGAGTETKGFSQWPNAIGFGAIGDVDLVRRFAEIARQEYRAVGINMALSPQADLYTEPRWSRGVDTFGSTASAVSPLVAAYVAGFQGSDRGLARGGVAAIVKHWVGYGALPDGFDSHNYYGRRAKLDRGFQQHVDAFGGAFRMKVAGLMPSYNIPGDLILYGSPVEQVASGFNKQLLEGLLRGKLKYQGLVLSDWSITEPCSESCRHPTRPVEPPNTPWGVEDLTTQARYAKGVVAGIDQFGGVDDVQPLAKAVAAGDITEARLDESVKRIMIVKFEAGLFESPFVDVKRVATTVGSPTFVKQAAAAQSRAIVVLENDGRARFKPGTRVFVRGISASALRESGLVAVARPEDAEVAILRVATPSEMLHPMYQMGRQQHEGRLDFRDGDEDYEAIKAVSAKVPTVVAVYLDRAAILTNVRDKAALLLCEFGASDQALLAVLTGRARAEGRLPFELPSSMAAVEAQHPALSNDSPRPLYPSGYRFRAAR